MEKTVPGPLIIHPTLCTGGWAVVIQSGGATVNQHPPARTVKDE
jgi:hypothetical protein